MTTNPLYDPYCILMKVYGEKAYLKQAIADTYIEEAYRARTVKVVYGVLENDEYFRTAFRAMPPNRQNNPCACC